MLRKALVVGINRYPSLKNSEGDPQHLQYPAADAREIYRLLKEYGQYEVKLLPEIDREPDRPDNIDRGSINQRTLEQEIINLFNPPNGDIPSTALLYFAGHGLLQTSTNGNQHYLATSDTNNKTKYGVSFEFLRSQLAKSLVREQIIWLDCCYSGAFTDFNFVPENENQRPRPNINRFFITASRRDESAYGFKGHGLLTSLLLRGLNPDQDRRGEWISSNSLNNFVMDEWQKSETLSKALQKPRFLLAGESILFWPKLGASPLENKRPKNPWLDSIEPTIIFPDQHSQTVRSLAISADGKLLASGDEQGIIKVWNLTERRSLFTFPAHSHIILSLAFDPTTKILASTSAFAAKTGSIRLWDVDTGKLRQNLEGFTRSNSIRFSPDGRYIATGYGHIIDAGVKIWDIATGKVKYTLKGHGWEVNCLRFSPDSRLLVTGGQDGAIMTWNWRNEQRLMTLNRPTDFVGSLVSWFDSSVGSISSIDISPDGEIIASGGLQQPIILWSISTGKPWQILTEKFNNISAVLFSPYGNTLGGLGDDGKLRLWDWKRGELVNLIEEKVPLTSFVFTPDGKTLICGYEDGMIKVLSAG